MWVCTLGIIRRSFKRPRAHGRPASRAGLISHEREKPRAVAAVPTACTFLPDGVSVTSDTLLLDLPSPSLYSNKTILK